VTPGTLLHRLTGLSELSVNSAHHQAVKDVGPQVLVNAMAPDGVVEGIESKIHRFCLGVQWHPEFLIHSGDANLFAGLIKAAS
jgi:putative glutamine amidotransferase